MYSFQSALAGPDCGCAGWMPTSLEPPLKAPAKTDEALMTQLRRGDREALAELVRRYQNDIFRFCLHYVREVELAREMAQETFLKVYVARKRFDPKRKFKPWVLCIARNLCLNQLKRKKTVRMEALEEYASTARQQSGEVLRSPEDGPEEAAMAAERRELLARALESLNDEAREVLALRYFEKMSARQIAEIIGSTEGAVRTKLHRILTGLRKKYSSRKDDF